MTKDYYKILGLEKNCTKEDIKRAYKALAKKYHPDLNKDPSATEKFKEINGAASILGDDKKRAQYDQFGEAGPTGTGQGGFSGFDFSNFGFGNASGESDFEDIFDIFTGGGFGGFGRRRGRASYRGSDLRFDLDISLEEAATGVDKTISLTKLDRCKTCKGLGVEDKDDIINCPVCGGSGRMTRTQRTPFGIFQTTSTCSKCHGEGKIIEKPCRDCGGEGKTRISKKITVKIPAGVDSQTRLRVESEGEPGTKGGEPGDLYVFISVLPHKLFERHGDDITLEIPISFVQAALGDTIVVPTLDGKAKLKIPPGTQTNTTFRMQDKGLPHLNSTGKGSQNVKVIIETPRKLSKKQRELLEAFAEESGVDAKPNDNFFSRILGGI